MDYQFMTKLWKMFDRLDELRLKGESDYSKREALMSEFGVTQSDADYILEDYRKVAPNRKQFLSE